MNEQPQKYYKFLGKNHKSKYQWFDYTPYLPNEYRPGIWLPKTKRVFMCQIGYHAAHAYWLHEWADMYLYEAQLKGEVVYDAKKVAGQQMRLLRMVDTWNNKTVRRFLYWYAKECTDKANVIHSRFDGDTQALEVIRKKIDNSFTEFSVKQQVWLAISKKRLNPYRNVMWECIDNKPYYVALINTINYGSPMIDKNRANGKLRQMLEI